MNIAATVQSHFADIGHDPSVLDITFENAQARVRTLELMDLANQQGGLVIGTGDLSELALGWATYNGDHMSMYGVNAGIPKTLVRHLVAYEAARAESEELRRVLLDILDTPVSPELLPADENGQIAQQTEQLVGPYELHDFTSIMCCDSALALPRSCIWPVPLLPGGTAMRCFCTGWRTSTAVSLCSSSSAAVCRMAPR